MDTAINILISAAEATEAAKAVSRASADMHMPSEKALDGAGAVKHSQFNTSSSTHRSRNQEQSEQLEIDTRNNNNINSKRKNAKPVISSTKIGLYAAEGPKKINKKCNFFLAAVGCRNGSNCKFIHDTNSSNTF